MRLEFPPIVNNTLSANLSRWPIVVSSKAAARDAEGLISHFETSEILHTCDQLAVDEEALSRLTEMQVVVEQARR